MHTQNKTFRVRRDSKPQDTRNDAEIKLQSQRRIGKIWNNKIGSFKPKSNKLQECRNSKRSTSVTPEMLEGKVSIKISNDNLLNSNSITVKESLLSSNFDHSLQIDDGFQENCIKNNLTITNSKLKYAPKHAAFRSVDHSSSIYRNLRERGMGTRQRLRASLVTKRNKLFTAQTYHNASNSFAQPANLTSPFKQRLPATTKLNKLFRKRKDKDSNISQDLDERVKNAYESFIQKS